MINNTKGYIGKCSCGNEVWDGEGAVYFLEENGTPVCQTCDLKAQNESFEDALLIEDDLPF